MKWDSAAYTRLRERHSCGLSDWQLAAEFGCTRNAVIGARHRAGLLANGKPNSSRPVNEGRPVKAKPQARAVSRNLIAADGVGAVCVELRARASSGPCTVLELTSTNCHWPNGDVGNPDFHFCGVDAVQGLPYCAQHSRIAYRKPGEYR